MMRIPVPRDVTIVTGSLFAFVSLFTSLRLTIIELEWLEHVDRLINVSKSTTTRLVSHLPLHIQVTRYNMCQF